MFSRSPTVMALVALVATGAMLFFGIGSRSASAASLSDTGFVTAGGTDGSFQTQLLTSNTPADPTVSLTPSAPEGLVQINPASVIGTNGSQLHEDLVLDESLTATTTTVGSVAGHVALVNDDTAKTAVGSDTGSIGSEGSNLAAVSVSNVLTSSAAATVVATIALAVLAVCVRTSAGGLRIALPIGRVTTRAVMCAVGTITDRSHDANGTALTA